ncbi:MAG: hypothetical protein M0R17_07500 [Candidatus Omnitrophica bacterium]|jgi:hypothetical protein|nr:hypothetical protein [Candidatus Omnitrophota bacterium]
MTKQEIIKVRYPFFDEDIYRKDIELNAEAVMELMDDYLLSELKSLVEYCKSVYPLYPGFMIERMEDRIEYIEHKINHKSDNQFNSIS